MSNITTAQAISKLCEELKKDSGYFYSWQANIAMQFKDNCHRAGVDFPQLHEIANKSAIDFLNVLMIIPEVSDEQL